MWSKSKNWETIVAILIIAFVGLSMAAIFMTEALTSVEPKFQQGQIVKMIVSGESVMVLRYDCAFYACDYAVRGQDGKVYGVKEFELDSDSSHSRGNK